jgi:hypothetical protein
MLSNHQDIYLSLTQLSRISPSLSCPFIQTNGNAATDSELRRARIPQLRTRPPRISQFGTTDAATLRR